MKVTLEKLPRMSLGESRSIRMDLKKTQKSAYKLSNDQFANAFNFSAYFMQIHNIIQGFNRVNYVMLTNLTKSCDDVTSLSSTAFELFQCRGYFCPKHKDAKMKTI